MAETEKEAADSAEGLQTLLQRRGDNILGLEEGIQFSSLIDLSFHTLQSKRREPILVLGDQVAKAQDQR